MGSLCSNKILLEADPTLYAKCNFYGRYYVLEQDTQRKIIVVHHNKETQREKMDQCGFFGYLGPAGLTSQRVLEITRNRDYIEKDYEAYKSRMRRPRHSLEEHLEGKIFLVYIDYEYNRFYDPVRKFNIPKRTTIGKQSAHDPSMILPGCRASTGEGGLREAVA